MASLTEPVSGVQESNRSAQRWVAVTWRLLGLMSALIGMLYWLHAYAEYGPDVSLFLSPISWLLCPPIAAVSILGLALTMVTPYLLIDALRSALGVVGITDGANLVLFVIGPTICGLLFFMVMAELGIPSDGKMASLRRGLRHGAAISLFTFVTATGLSMRLWIVHDRATRQTSLLWCQTTSMHPILSFVGPTAWSAAAPVADIYRRVGPPPPLDSNAVERTVLVDAGVRFAASSVGGVADPVVGHRTGELLWQTSGDGLCLWSKEVVGRSGGSDLSWLSDFGHSCQASPLARSRVRKAIVSLQEMRAPSLARRLAENLVASIDPVTEDRRDAILDQLTLLELLLAEDNSRGVIAWCEFIRTSLVKEPSAASLFPLVVERIAATASEKQIRLGSPFEAQSAP